MTKIGAFIPARYAAIRFPAKLMQVLGAKTVIRHTYDNTVATGLFNEVYVVTDSEIIFNEITSHGGKALMSKKEHESGSDRIAEAIEHLDIDIVVNVQGDEPFVKKEPLEKLIAVFKDEKVEVASLMQALTNSDLIADPNYVKVAVAVNCIILPYSRTIASSTSAGYSFSELQAAPLSSEDLGKRHLYLALACNLISSSVGVLTLTSLIFWLVLV